MNIAELKKLNSSLTTEVEAASSENASLAAERDTLQSQNEELATQVAELTSAAENAPADLTETVAELTEASEAASARIALLETELSTALSDDAIEARVQEALVDAAASAGVPLGTDTKSEEGVESTDPNLRGYDRLLASTKVNA